MRLRRPHVASLDQVRITREGEDAVIEYLNPGVSTTHLKVGPEVESMTDEEILDLHNVVIRTQEQIAAEYEHIAVEVPAGSAQVMYCKESMQWVPRSAVLRCLISDGGPDGELTVYIDEEELSLAEFGRLLCTYAGWGMRIAFVPEDETNQKPRIEIRKPDVLGFE